MDTNTKNPFCLEPISNPEDFFNFEREIRRILNLLSKKTCVSIVGPPGIGRTSFLRHAADPSVRVHYGVAERQIFIYIDGHTLSSINKSLCLMTIRQEVVRQVRDVELADEALNTWLDRELSDPNTSTSSFGIQTLFRTMQNHELELVLVFDDFDPIAENPYLDESFFTFLRSLSTNLAITYFIALEKPLHTLEKIGLDSPFFNIFQPIYLKPWSDEKSKKWIVERLKWAEVNWPDFAIDLVLDLGHNEPYRLQKAGHVIFQTWQAHDGKISISHSDQIRRKFRDYERFE